MPTHADAAKAHLQATWNAAHVFGPTSKEYRELVDEHLRLWPDSSTANDARLWLGRALQSERKWAEALNAYKHVRANAASGTLEQAVLGATVCVDRILDEMSAVGKSASTRRTFADENANWFESLSKSLRRGSGDQLLPAERLAVVAAARLRLRHVASADNKVTTLLDDVERRTANAPSEWFARVALLQIEAAAHQGDFAKAEKRLARIQRAPAEAVRELLASLAALRESGTLDEASARRMAEIELAAGKLTEATGRDNAPVGPANSAARRKAEADAMAAAGRRQEAIAAYRKLAAEYADNAAVQRGYAALLRQGNDNTSLSAALAQWRRVEERTKSGTTEWFAAKYEVALLHERLGDKPQALRVVTLLAALYPDLGGAELKSKFEALRKRCQP
jgi:tetratricopeptide (TPR) repeat protein